ncbi:MAG: OsmC family protein [Tepidanaerobacteraceae bacterium]|nr:OsmC family protein [Tepidanaerobacteraceae bacterium]
MALIKTYSATAKKIGELSVETEARGFKIIVDEPVEKGGTNKGMNPVELLLCSLGACQTMAVSIFAEQLKINIEEIWMEIEGDLDSYGFMGYGNARSGYQNIRYHMHIKSDAPEEKINELIELVEKRCPVADSIKNGVKLDKPKITIVK